MPAESFDLVLKIGQLGMSGVLLVLLNKLWGAFEQQNKFIRDMLTQAQEDREAIAGAIGAQVSREKPIV